MAFSTYTPAFTDDVSVIPSTYLNQIRVDMGRAVDGNAGGTYAGVITWNGMQTFGGGATLPAADTFTNAGSIIHSGNSLVQRRLAVLGDADADILPNVDEYRFTTAPTVARTFTLRHTGVPVPLAGSRIRVIITIASAFNVAIFKREDATELARLAIDAGVDIGGCVEFTYHPAGNGWYCSLAAGTGNVTLHS